MRIDEHRHIGNCGSRKEVLAEDILKDLDECDVDKAIIAPGSHKIKTLDEEVKYTADFFSAVKMFFDTGEITPQIEAFQKNTPCHDKVIEAIEQNSDRLLGCWWLNPHLKQDGIIKAYNNISKYSLKYIKLHPPQHAFKADDFDLLEPVVRLAIKLDIPLWFHSNSGPGTEARRLKKLALNFKDVKIIMGHILLSSLIPEKENTPFVTETVKKVKNLWIDLSSARKSSLSYVIKECPEDKLLMATDTPWHGTSLKEMIENIKEICKGNGKLKEKIMGKNASKLLNLNQ